MSDAEAAPCAQAVLEHIVRSVVEAPEAVRVVAVTDGDDVRLDVHVDRADIGRVIGRRGRVAGAIRTVVRAAAVNDGRSVSVDFVEP
ncbi:MAG: KH domain-containing protein [bacterium]|nr:KH domain-containing protein [bacterium]MXZ31465.1 KH domain-containing protein [Acidimicrobiia bacterium]MDE0669155.1 KH domain-containing protein [bacterium]MYB25251.1 KH domain-containing protein [Acidimicrobiia bacterium]MYE68343.1 KH domain-containing protein [Acidimicrobiia bacterium]